MTEAEFHDAILARLGAIEGHLMVLSGDMGAVKLAMHTPNDCALTPRLLHLELAEARQRGMLAIVGTIAGLVAAGVVGVIIRLLPVR